MNDWVKASMEGKRPNHQRFSKEKLAHHLARKIHYLANIHKFDHDNGWVQVEGKGEEINRAYGEYLGMVHIAMTMEIEAEMWAKVNEMA